MFVASFFALCALAFPAFSVPVATTTTGSVSPATFLNLGSTSYTLQLPIGTGGVAKELAGTSLASYSSDYFYVNKTGVTLYTPNTGVTTSGSLHPRTELKHNTNWKSSSSTFKNMTVSLQVDAVAPGKSVVISQILSFSNGPQFMVHAYEIGKIVIRAPSGTKTLDANYKIGSALVLNFSASSNVLSVTYKNLVSGATSSQTFAMTAYSDNYYKAGSYCQIVVGDAGYCQVTMSSLTVTTA
ncbi:hypothetical protein HDU79_002104 [Rhizoclosmatium sp. JEL0117]|nr:hypothetical protein HDU79_002104 [Rhizoclosmatium sp. JEL0117]